MVIWIDRCQLFCHNQGIYLNEYIQVAKHLLFQNGSLSLMFPCPLLLSKLVTGSRVMGTSIMKESRCYSSIIHRTSILTYCKASFAFFVFFFSVWLSFTNIHVSQDSTWRERLSPYILSTDSTRFHNTY